MAAAKKPMPKKPMPKPMAPEPIPAKYRDMPPDVARAMMASDKMRADPKFQKAAKHAQSAGRVKNTGAGIQQKPVSAAEKRRVAKDIAGARAVNKATKKGFRGRRGYTDEMIEKF